MNIIAPSENMPVAVLELMVAADMMLSGYNIFRAQSPACPCDLIAMKDGEMLRVEVRTVGTRANGTISPAIKPRDYCNLYAFVDYDNVIHYRPRGAVLRAIGGTSNGG